MAIEVGQRIQILRKRCGLSIRRLAEMAGVAAGMISCIERGKNSPSIATLQKILAALGTNLADFFGTQGDQAQGPIFVREHMRSVSDGQRTYTIVFPDREGIGVEMLDEHISPASRKPPYEKLQCDVAGYVLSGSLTLDVRPKLKQTLRPGDAFYIPRGTEHRGYVSTDEPARLITAYYPEKY